MSIRIPVFEPKNNEFELEFRLFVPPGQYPIEPEGNPSDPIEPSGATKFPNMCFSLLVLQGKLSLRAPVRQRTRTARTGAEEQVVHLLVAACQCLQAMPWLMAQR